MAHEHKVNIEDVATEGEWEDQSPGKEEEGLSWFPQTGACRLFKWPNY